jgi:hypothetical protein
MEETFESFIKIAKSILGSHDVDTRWLYDVWHGADRDVNRAINHLIDGCETQRAVQPVAQNVGTHPAAQRIPIDLVDEESEKEEDDIGNEEEDAEEAEEEEDEDEGKLSPQDRRELDLVLVDIWGKNRDGNFSRATECARERLRIAGTDRLNAGAQAAQEPFKPPAKRPRLIDLVHAA